MQSLKKFKKSFKQESYLLHCIFSLILLNYTALPAVANDDDNFHRQIACEPDIIYRVCFFGTSISFSCYFYTNKDIEMRSFVMCNRHWVLFFFVHFFRYYIIIFRDCTKNTKRGKFQVTGCLNVIMLSQDAS